MVLATINISITIIAYKKNGVKHHFLEGYDEIWKAKKF